MRSAPSGSSATTRESMASKRIASARWEGSSGGHLVSMLGVLDGKGDPESASPVDGESAKVQCVVARAPITDFFRLGRFNPFLGMPNPGEDQEGTVEYRMYKEASPVSHVSAGDPPFLFIHGDADEVVPLEQSEVMIEALRAADVPAELLVIPGGGHGPAFPGAADPPDYLGAMVRWLDRYLQA
jgi:dipeptidyl aminopeptidase/acylaminoacyl peptidase